MQQIDRIEDWAGAVDNRAAVPGHAAHFAAWAERAAAFRGAQVPVTRAYGETEREAVDLWLPEGPPHGVMVFFHGGWWMNFSKDTFSHLAAGPLARGWAVAIPGYTLAPAASLTTIMAQALRAVSMVGDAVPDVPLVLAGHSAGGHLAAMCGVAGALDARCQQRLARIVSISGVHDLRPLRGIAINETLGITAEEAHALSPALHRPRPGFDCVAWVGADELPEFRRQNALLAVAWGGYAATRIVEAAGADHFTVLEPLAEPDSELTRLVTPE